MVSIKSRLVSTIIAKRYYKSRHASVEEHYDDVIENVEARTAPTVVPKNISGESAFRVTQEDFNGWEVFHLKPTSGLSDKAIVYWHGGAFVKEIAEQHWDFCSRLVRELKVPIIIPMYTLAPKGNAAEWEANAIKLCVQLSKDERYRSLDIVHMGDSAGGWCVLRLLEALCEKALEGDAEVEHALKSTTKGVMYSPLVSMEVTDNLMKIAESDIWLGPDLMHAITPLWCVGPQAVPRVLKALSPEVQAQHSAPATEISLVDPKYSPLYGLDVFTKYHEAKPDHAPFNLLVFSGTADITWAGTSQLEAKVNALGNDVIKYEQQVEQNIYHVYQLTPIPEAEKAWKKTKEFLQ